MKIFFPPRNKARKQGLFLHVAHRVPPRTITTLYDKQMTARKTADLLAYRAKVKMLKAALDQAKK
ncbi:hypothetical protein CPI84_15885 [Erwinia pyrifoliae]|nr:hypothetical protein CPI84_15885 [Erwinia pyrifoliae]